VELVDDHGATVAPDERRARLVLQGPERVPDLHRL